ncbi:MAG: class I SAM-dependent methyltransferase [Chitinophagaceae bacterium]|nr:class I SAM-dependent methyltransferase [Chitinophagaceae bacterium]
MSNTNRVDKQLFQDEHYLGKPADEDDRIVKRRIDILNEQVGFFNKEMTCLEIGCGTGATINQVAKEFSDCVGVDIYDYAADFEKQQLKWNATNTRFQQVNLEKETLQSRFDRIISFEVIEHFENEDTVAAFFNLLKPGGLVAISVPNKWWVFETHGAKLPLLPWNRVPFFSWLPRPIHERWANARIYTKQRIGTLLKKHGFQIQSMEYVTAPMDVLSEGKLKRLLTSTVFKNDTTGNPFIATAIFVLAKKPL